MTKEDFQRVVKEKMKELGFSSRRGKYYMKVDADYVIGVSLDHSPYTHGYYVEYGALFLPDEKRWPFKGWYDWDSRFKFTGSGRIELSDLHPGIYGDYDDQLVRECAEYEGRSEKNLAHELEVNYEKCIIPLLNKEFVLNDYRNNWIKFRGMPCDKIEKICRLADLNYDEVMRIRDSNVTKWPV